MSQELDLLTAALAPLGFAAQPRRTVAYHHRGLLGGRPVDVYCTRETRRSSVTKVHNYIGHLLEIVVDTPLRTRMVFGTSNDTASWINRRFNLQPVEIPPPGYGDHQLFALDGRWARDFLTDRAIEPALRALLADPDRFNLFSVQARPETLTVLLRTELASVTPEVLRGWVETAAALAEAGVRIPPPSRPVPASAWERWSRQNRHLVVWAGVGAFFGVVALLALGAAACCLAVLLVDRLI